MNVCTIVTKFYSKMCSKFAYRQARRNEVCRLAHDMCHLGYKRTKETLRLNYFWPGMSKTIREYVDTCLACHKTARAVIKDMVPISIVPCDRVSFSHLYMDVVGPVFNKAEYNFLVFD